MSAEDKIDRLMDARGFTLEQANQIVNGTELPRLVGATAVHVVTENFPNRSSHPRPSNRGGRSYPEPGDSELDPDWNVHQESPVSDQQAEADKGGVLLARAVVRFTRQDDIIAMSAADRSQAVSSFMQGYSKGRVA
ncbi:MAG: hypothetical protein ABI716_02105 [Candidatus Saccharibacteria bacterium]